MGNVDNVGACIHKSNKKVIKYTYIQLLTQ